MDIPPGPIPPSSGNIASFSLLHACKGGSARLCRGKTVACMVIAAVQHGSFPPLQRAAAIIMHLHGEVTTDGMQEARWKGGVGNTLTKASEVCKKMRYRCKRREYDNRDQKAILHALYQQSHATAATSIRKAQSHLICEEISGGS